MTKPEDRKNVNAAVLAAEDRARDEFAAIALRFFMKQLETIRVDDKVIADAVSQFVKASYEVADAMMAERAKRIEVQE